MGLQREKKCILVRRGASQAVQKGRPIGMKTRGHAEKTSLEHGISREVHWEKKKKERIFVVGTGRSLSHNKERREILRSNQTGIPRFVGESPKKTVHRRPDRSSPRGEEEEIQGDEMATGRKRASSWGFPTAERPAKL